jgi:large subunit ribosomal protein L6
MSRIGRKPIEIKDGVNVEEKAGVVTVTGSKGTLEYRLPGCVRLNQDDKTLTVECDAGRSDKKERALFGTARAILQNMITGVSDGFKRELEIQGVGYRGQCQGSSKLVLNLGYSHPVEFFAPEGVTVSMPENTKIVVEGIDKQLVGEAAAKIRSFRPPDNYKGKGIRYVGEYVQIKEGKTVA